MRVISNKEFNTNRGKYFNPAVDEEVCTKRNTGVYNLMHRPIEKQYPEQEILEPDEDFYRAITMNEFLIGVKEDIREIFRKGEK